MNLKSAHENIDAAKHAINAWLIIGPDQKVVLALLEMAKNGKDLGISVAFLKAARAVFGDVECDEHEVIRGYMKKALAEFEYQSQKEAA